MTHTSLNGPRRSMSIKPKVIEEALDLNLGHARTGFRFVDRPRLGRSAPVDAFNAPDLGGFVALNYAIRHPEHPARLVLASTAAHVHVDRVLAMFERIGGDEVRAVAERTYADATADNLAEYLRVCVPLYTRRPIPPEVLARVTMRRRWRSISPAARSRPSTSGRV